MEKAVENSQIEEFIANLKGRKAYEEKKAIKLGFSNFEDYVADKISNDLSKSSDICKAPKKHCLLYTSPSPRDGLLSRMPSSA